MFDEIKESLKEKWLEYYEANSAWLKIAATKNGSYRTNREIDKEEFTRPSGILMLGVLTTLEPQLSSFMCSAVELNTDPELIIKSLGLDFDPDKELEKLKSGHQ